MNDTVYLWNDNEIVKCEKCEHWLFADGSCTDMDCPNFKVLPPVPVPLDLPVEELHPFLFEEHDDFPDDDDDFYVMCENCGDPISLTESEYESYRKTGAEQICRKCVNDLVESMGADDFDLD
jgi:hypothetical protein